MAWNSTGQSLYGVVEHWSIQCRVLFHCEVLHHDTSVKGYNIGSSVSGYNCWFPTKGYRLTGFLVSGLTLLVDTSDSPSIVSSHNKGAGCSCISWLTLGLWLCGLSYALCLLPSLLRCCGFLLCCVSLSSNLLDCSPSCPQFWACAASFIHCIFAMHFGIACLGLCIVG